MPLRPVYGEVGDGSHFGGAAVVASSGFGAQGSFNADQFPDVAEGFAVQAKRRSGRTFPTQAPIIPRPCPLVSRLEGLCRAARPVGADLGRGHRRDHHAAGAAGEHALRSIVAPCIVFTLPDA